MQRIGQIPHASVDLKFANLVNSTCTGADILSTLAIMETIPLLKLTRHNQFSVSPIGTTSLSKSAREAVRQQVVANPLIIELRVGSGHLDRARKSSAQNGNAEVLSESGLFLATADGRVRPIDLAIQCRSVGPIRVTTYDEWISQD